MKKIIYAYTFNAYQTHVDINYKNRVKIGETSRDAIIRIDEQDTTAVSEPPIMLGQWVVETTVEDGLDNLLRDYLVTNHGFKVARTDKQREWVIFPEGIDVIDCIETAIDRLDSIDEVITEFKQITLRDEGVAILAETDTIAKGTIVAACGVGKTYIELAIHEKFLPQPQKREVNVVISSGIDLVEQVVSEFTNATVYGLSKRAWYPIVVHSGRFDKADRKNDGFLRTTDSDQIAAAIKKAKKPVCLFTTYDSVREMAAGIEKAGYVVNVKIMDEAHRAVTYGQTKFSWAARLEGKREYALTATPRYIKT